MSRRDHLHYTRQRGQQGKEKFRTKNTVQIWRHEEKSAVWHLQKQKSVDFYFFANAPHFSCPHVKCFCTDSQNISPKMLFFLSKKTICTERWKSKSTNKSELIPFFLFLSLSVENVFYKHALISSPIL